MLSKPRTYVVNDQYFKAPIQTRLRYLKAQAFQHNCVHFGTLTAADRTSHPLVVSKCVTSANKPD